MLARACYLAMAATAPKNAVKKTARQEPQVEEQSHTDGFGGLLVLLFCIYYSTNKKRL